MDRPSSPSTTVEEALAQLTQARYPIIYNTMTGISYLDIHEPFHRHLMNTPFSDPQIGLLALLISDLCNSSSHKEIRRGVLSLCQTHFEQCVAVTPSCCLSNVAFVGHLYNLGVLAETVVQRMLNYLLEERSKRTRLVAMACTLLATTGRRLDRIMVQDSSWSERLGELQSKTSDYKVKEMVEYSLKLVNGHSDTATAQSALQSVSVYLMSYLHNTIKKNNITANGTPTPVQNSSSSPTNSEAENKGAMSFRRSASKSFLSLGRSSKKSDLDIPTTPSSRGGRIKEELSPKSRKESTFNTFKSNRSESSDICIDSYVPTVSELRQLSRADLRRLLITIEGILSEEDSSSPRPSSGSRSGFASESPIAQRWAAWEASQPFAVVDAEDF